MDAKNDETGNENPLNSYQIHALDCFDAILQTLKEILAELQKPISG